MGTGKQIAEYARSAYEGKGGYIWGQSGAIWTTAKQETLVKKYNSDPAKYSDYKMSAEYGSKWIGHNVWDCSGLSMRAAEAAGVSIHHGSNSIWRSDLKETGQKTTGIQLPEGAFVFTGKPGSMPHIGIVTGPDEVTEAKGTKAGVVHSKLSDKKWTYWGLCKDVEFDGEPEPGPEPTPGTWPTLRKGSTGPYVVECQKELIWLGYDCGPTGADGIYGDKTAAAVKAFQKANPPLVADGICGPKTWEALHAAIWPYPDPEPDPVGELYTVTIPHLQKDEAEELVENYAGAIMQKERG